MGDRAHLSIGEVLSLLQDEFPDITISKIRFLESQGLLDPERTPSGYRKFYESDIERLRWILVQQRENFLPLRVIKARLEEASAAGLVVPLDEPEPLAEPVAEPSDEGAPEREPERQPAGVSAASGAARRNPDLVEEPRPSRRAARSHRLDPGPTGVSLTREELCEVSGLSARDLGELERFGLLVGRPVGADLYFDDDALVVARSAAGFLRFGIEARHLRMYKVAAEREAGFFEQVVMPLLKQRNPDARRRAAETLGELGDLGERLRAALLRAALAEHR